MTGSPGRSCKNVGPIAVVLLAGAAAIVGSSFGNQDRRPRPAPTFADLHEFDLLARLPPREKQLSGTGGWRLHEVAQEIGRRAREGQLSDRGWVELLVREEFIHTRPRWSTNVPFEISLKVPHWIAPMRIVVEAIEPPIGSVQFPQGFAADEVACGNMPDPVFRFGSLPASTRAVTFEVSIEDMGNPWSPYSRLRDGSTDWKGRWKVPVEAVDGAEDCLLAAKGPAVDAAVRASLSAGIGRGSSDPTLLWLRPDAEKHPVLAAVGLSLAVELLEAGQAIERTSLTAGSGWRGTGSCTLEELPRKLAEAPGVLAHRQIRVRGEPNGVLPLWEDEFYWAGELTIPLAELIERGRQRR